MIFRLLSIAFSTLAVLLPAPQAEAVEPLSLKELASYCAHYNESPTGQEAILCVRYIQGFIDGAVATDKRVTLNVAAEYSGAESYSDRAMRTRSPRRLAQYGPTVYAEFCLGAPVPLQEVVERVASELEQYVADKQWVYARTAVYQTLRRTYPCEAAGGE